MADETSGHEKKPAQTSEAPQQGHQGHPGEGEKPAGVGPVDKKEEIEQQPT